MKPGYLGDCLDFYKRWFLAEFFPREQQVLQDAIVPNVAVRSAYFQVVGHPGHDAKDLFLDPDTGLRLGSRPKRRRFDEYLFGHELTDFVLPIGSMRVAVVYDQSIARGSEAEEYAELKMHVLRDMGLCAFAYCAQVAMVVVSRDKGRITALHQHAQGLAHLPQDRVLVV